VYIADLELRRGLQDSYYSVPANERGQILLDPVAATPASGCWTRNASCSARPYPASAR